MSKTMKILCFLFLTTSFVFSQESMVKKAEKDLESSDLKGAISAIGRATNQAKSSKKAKPGMCMDRFIKLYSYQMRK